MRIEFQVIAALALDLLIGDPRWLPHPVTGIAWMAHALERPIRRAFPLSRLAGTFVAVAVIAATASSAWLLVWGAGRIHPIAADVISILIIYTCLAARDLAGHANRVYRALVDGNISLARNRVAMLVSRDTNALDEEGLVRATVESVAESTSDGVTAPLLFAIAFGPVGAVVYKAINTLDAIFGYTDERYAQFGWASARLDDAANFIPARITGAFMVLAASLLGMGTRRSLRTFLRDRKRHPSPNSGHPEAAMAGALGVRLGGTNIYFGQAHNRPSIGETHDLLRPDHILWANRLMWATLILTATCGLSLRWFIDGL
ncbi:MAG: adenosylcobinamide-phosphate synthase CbiB [Myxococcota bacterium]|nr:adenosylcobinamide-phosphate synthase CbiB [Myxococcota bacterium]